MLPDTSEIAAYEANVKEGSKGRRLKMKFHKRKISITCQSPHCEATARYEVLNERNSSQGEFCAVHAKEEIELASNAETPQPQEMAGDPND